MALKIGKLVPNKSVLLLCDMQEKFSKIIQHFDQVVETSGKIAEFAKILNINTYVTEHYPKGLGRTVLPLKEKIGNAQYFEKTLFSMCTQEVSETLKSKNPGNCHMTLISRFFSHRNEIFFELALTFLRLCWQICRIKNDNKCLILRI